MKVSSRPFSKLQAAKEKANSLLIDYDIYEGKIERYLKTMHDLNLVRFSGAYKSAPREQI